MPSFTICRAKGELILKPEQADFFLSGDVNLTPSDAAVGLIVCDDGRYLMQLRSQKPGIFYPGHWGLFGGAVDPGEMVDAALSRELREELGIEVLQAQYFTEFSFDFGFCGHGRVRRRYYKIEIASSSVDGMILGEGSEMRRFHVREILIGQRVVPYDAFAIWLHATQKSASPSARSETG
jgi:8-oxo-dGTP pyrophosphatase MutT (NUDIX family)